MSQVPCLSLCPNLLSTRISTLACLKCLKHLTISLSQVLGVSEEPGGVFAKFHEVHYQFTLPPFPLHCGLCFARDAAVWGTVSIKYLNTVLFVILLHFVVILCHVIFCFLFGSALSIKYNLEI